jgi:hypothetical protein
VPFGTLLRIFCGYAPVWTAESGDDMGGKSGVRGYTGGLEKHFVASMRRTELEPRAKLKRLYYSVRKSLALTDETRAKYTRKFDTYRKNNASERADQFRALLNEVGKDFERKSRNTLATTASPPRQSRESSRPTRVRMARPIKADGSG